MKHTKRYPTVRISQDVHEELMRYARSVGLRMSIIVETVISEYIASGKDIRLG